MKHMIIIFLISRTIQILHNKFLLMTAKHVFFLKPKTKFLF